METFWRAAGLGAHGESGLLDKKVFSTGRAIFASECVRLVDESMLLRRELPMLAMHRGEEANARKMEIRVPATGDAAAGTKPRQLTAA